MGTRSVAVQTVVTSRGSVVTVVINRPKVRNAVNQETARRLLGEQEASRSDPALKRGVPHGKTSLLPLNTRPAVSPSRSSSASPPPTTLSSSGSSDLAEAPEERPLCASEARRKAAVQIAGLGLRLQLLLFFFHPHHFPFLSDFPAAILCNFVVSCKGNLCAGYDLRELANHTASLKLEQDVTKGPGPIGELLRGISTFPYDFN
ncbi:LOW QUALITY PROTEIN: uncharacterized protein AB9W97_005349 [Spinachia spinachia]